MWLFVPMGVIAAALILFAAACTSAAEPSREYSDEELGTDAVIEDYLRDLVPFAQYRTSADKDLDSVDPMAGSGHERERNYFENSIRLVLLAASETLPPEVARGSGVLHDALYAAIDECAAEAGWPGVQLYDVSQQLGEQYEREFGLTVEMFLDLRHECSRYASAYPTLDPAYRDELLSKRRAHYVAAVQDWMAANPDHVVPVEFHEGANKPVEDHWIRECQKTDDPQQCARDHRVTLP